MVKASAAPPVLPVTQREHLRSVLPDSTALPANLTQPGQDRPQVTVV